MASLNGNANTIVGSVGLFGGSAGVGGSGANAENFEGEMPDAFTFAYTATNATPAIFTAIDPSNNLASAGGSGVLNIPTGATVTLGGVSYGYYQFTATSASPGVFTSVELANAGLNVANMPVAVYGAAPGGITVTGTNDVGPYSQYPAAPTIYFIKSPSGNTFNLSATAGGAAINTTSAVTANGWLQVLDAGGNIPTGFTTLTTYYVTNVSASTFKLSLPATPTTFIASTSTGAGLFQIANNNTDSQINYAATSGAVSGMGYRYGASQVVGSANVSLLSLDENPQLAWQNVPGATCQSGQSLAMAGSSNNTFPSGQGSTVGISGWGAAGGFISGQPVYEVKAPVSESPEHRMARLHEELAELNSKKNLTRAETERKKVVEDALKDEK